MAKVTMSHCLNANLIYKWRRSMAQDRDAAIAGAYVPVKLNGHEPYAYLKDALQRLLTQRACDIDELLPHHWVPAT